MAQAKPKPLDRKTQDLCKELVTLRRKNASVFAREEAIETTLKDIATKRGEGFKVDLPDLGTVTVAGRKEKEFQGEAPEADVETWAALSAAARKSLIKKGIVKIVQLWSGAFYGRVTVKVF